MIEAPVSYETPMLAEIGDFTESTRATTQGYRWDFVVIFTWF